MLRFATEAIRLDYTEQKTEGGSELRISGRNGMAWEHTLNAATISSPTLLLDSAGARAFVLYGFEVVQLDAHTGKIHWRRKYSEPVWTGHLLATGDLLLHLELSVVCIAADGRELWRYASGEIITDIEPRGDKVYVTDFDQQQFALTLHNGDLHNGDLIDA